MPAYLQLTVDGGAVISELLARFGYAAVLVGAFVEGELVLLAAGAVSQSQRLSLPLVVVAGALGSVAWGQTWFHIGRASGAALLVRRPAWRGRAQRVERWLSSSGAWVLVGGRFLAGMGTVLPSVIGASGLSRRRFTVLDTLGALLWSVAFSCAGFGVGAGLAHVPARHQLGLGLAVAATCAGLLLGLAWYPRRCHRRAPESVEHAPTLANAQAEAKLSKRVIVTGDDFGLAVAINEAVEIGHQRGILTTTSLLVGEPAAVDAVARARRNPQLRVGLHLALCEGTPSLPAPNIPLLTNRRGELLAPATALIWFMLCAPSARFRRQLEAEIRAQFAAFQAFGLPLDHVNGHNNMQLHPVVLPILIKVAREYGVKAVRVPYEPLLASWRAARRGFAGRLGVWLVMCLWATRVKRRLLRSGFVVNDYLFGIFDCGAMERDLFKSIILQLPYGLSEIHCHPATRRCPEIDRAAPHYLHEAELQALIDPQVRAALVSAGVQLLAGFGGEGLEPGASPSVT